MKKNFNKTLSLLLAMCLFAFIFTPAAFAEDSEDSSAPKSVLLNLDSVYTLGYEGGVDSKIANQQLQVFYDALDKLNDKMDAAAALAGSPDPFSKLAGTITMNSLIPNQITSENKKAYELSVELSKRQVALGGRTMLIAYLNAQYQYDQLRLDADRLERETATHKIMTELGMKTGLEQKTLEQSLGKLKSSLSVIGDGVSSLKAQLAVFLDIYEPLMQIEPFKGHTASEAESLIAAADYSKDLSAAKEKCLTLQIQQLKRDGSYGVDRQLESLNLKKLNDRFGVDFEAVYKNLLHTQSSLKDAEGACAISEESYNYAKIRYSFGMISKNDLSSFESQYLSDGKKLSAAKLKFSAALYSYQAMLGGVWQQVQ